MRAFLLSLCLLCTACAASTDDYTCCVEPPNPPDAALPVCSAFCTLGESHYQCVQWRGQVTCTCFYSRDGETLTLPCAP